MAITLNWVYINSKKRLLRTKISIIFKAYFQKVVENWQNHLKSLPFFPKFLGKQRNQIGSSCFLSSELCDNFHLEQTRNFSLDFILQLIQFKFLAIPPKAFGSIDEMPFSPKWRKSTTPCNANDWLLIFLIALFSNLSSNSLVNDGTMSGILVICFGLISIHLGII